MFQAAFLSGLFMDDAVLTSAKQLFPEKDFTDFGQLIKFHYYYDPEKVLYGVVLAVYAHYNEICCLNWENNKPFTRRFWTGHYIGDFTDCATGEIFTPRAFYEKYVPIHYPERRFGDTLAGGSKSQPQICFTGFSAKRKAELQALGRTSDMWVTEKVRNHLEYLVCGSNAGPKKIEKAEKLGAVILTEAEFLEWIDK
nr:hypothetical protein [uncultured Kingella sp.]